MEKRVLVSACLLGVCCRYDGNSRPCEDVCREAAKRGWLPVCPEILGGLATPRIPAEQQGARVVNRMGTDVTKAYQRGAEETLRLAKLYGASYAVLKERSPSCGTGSIYDGSFSENLTKGMGTAAMVLERAGILVYGESQLQQLLEILDGGMEK